MAEKRRRNISPDRRRNLREQMLKMNARRREDVRLGYRAGWAGGRKKKLPPVIEAAIARASQNDELESTAAPPAKKIETADEALARIRRAHKLDGWDDMQGPIAPKSKAGVRLVPLPETLRAILAAHVERRGREAKSCSSAGRRRSHSPRAPYSAEPIRPGRS